MLCILMGKGQEDEGEEEDGWEGRALLPHSSWRVSESHSIPICSWGQIWEMAAPVHQPWGDRILTLSRAEGHGENSESWSAGPLLPGGLASSAWGR